MPEDIRKKGTVLSRLELLEEKLDDTVVDFCADRDAEQLAQHERTARTLASLLRETERLEEMKRKFEQGQDDDSEYSPAEVERMRIELKRRLDRLAKARAEGQVEQPAAAARDGQDPS